MSPLLKEHSSEFCPNYSNIIDPNTKHSLKSIFETHFSSLLPMLYSEKAMRNRIIFLESRQVVRPFICHLHQVRQGVRLMVNIGTVF